MKIEPKISANKLVEYCFARSTRRTAIIEDIIRPKNFLLDTRYNEIERAMMHFIETHGQDDSRLSQLDRALLARQPATSHDEQRLLTAQTLSLQNTAVVDRDFGTPWGTSPLVRGGMFRRSRRTTRRILFCGGCVRSEDFRCTGQFQPTSKAAGSFMPRDRRQVAVNSGETNC